MKNINNLPFNPPPNGIDVPLVHKLSETYKKIYTIGGKLPKRDRFGIHSEIEKICLEILGSIIAAAFETRSNKSTYLNSARVQIEILKRLVRIERDLNILEKKKYFELENELIEISKMIAGWIRFLNIKEPQ